MEAQNNDTYKTILKPSEEVLFKDKNSKFYSYTFPVKTEDEVKMIKRKDVVFDQTRSEQITALLDLGLTKKEIKALKYEEDRVNKIIELQDK